jgi:nucleotide-binding universal stress UspA family protein
MFSRRDGASVTLMHVLDPRAHEPSAAGLASTGTAPDAASARPTLGQVTEAAEAWLAESARALPDPARVELVTASGTPGEEILAAARRSSAGLIVMGRRGRGRVLPGVLGSTVSLVLRGAPCPVLVIVDPADAVLEEWAPES